MAEQSTNLATLKQNTAAIRPGDCATEVGFHSGDAFALLQRGATLLASSSMIPKRYQNNVGDCAIVINLAYRMRADILMVAQNLYVVHGTPAWSGQFLIATLNASRRFSALTYKFQGKEGTDDWGCRAVATELATGEKIEGTLITIGLAKKNGWYSKDGSKWQTMPEQMLRYRAAAWFVRAYAPEISMGLMTVEEAIEMTQDDTGDYVTAEITTETIKEQATAPMIRDKTKESGNAQVLATTAEIDTPPEPEKEQEPATPENYTYPDDDCKDELLFSERDNILASIRDEMSRLKISMIPATLKDNFGMHPEEIKDNIILKSLLSKLKERN